MYHSNTAAFLSVHVCVTQAHKLTAKNAFSALNFAK